MAKKAALGVIELGAAQAVGDLRSWRYSETADEIDTTIMGSGNKRMQPGATGETIEVDCFFVDGDAGQALAVTGSETPVAIKLKPQGTGVGLPQMDGTFYVLSREITGEVSGAIELTFSASSDENGAAWTAQ